MVNAADTRGFCPHRGQESANPCAPKPGGIAHHHISDTSIALFTHFIPCGVGEAVTASVLPHTTLGVVISLRSSRLKTRVDGKSLAFRSVQR